SPRRDPGRAGSRGRRRPQPLRAPARGADDTDPPRHGATLLFHPGSPDMPPALASPAIEVDMERIVRAARERGCALEINAQPERMDMPDIHAQLAGEEGVLVAISTDAHSVGDLDHMRFGVGQARRGWLSAEDVLNTRPLKALKAILRRAGAPN